MTRNQPALHALSVVPRSARPGEIVRVEFRTPNLGSQASPAGSVAFELDAGLEALGDLEAAVAPVAPGENVTAFVCARVGAPSRPRATCTVGAVLRIPGAELTTNQCTVEVRSRAIVDGVASGVFAEPLDAQTVLVRAVVTNEGDGPAAAMRVVVPPPAGCVPSAGDAATVMDVTQLAIGETATLAYEARLVSPRALLCATDAEVHVADGGRYSVPARNSIALAAALAAPVLVVQAGRRRAELAVELSNEGWVDARDVRVRFVLPPPLRLVDGSVTVAGVHAVRAARRGAAEAPYARVERRTDGHAVVIDTVVARGVTPLALALTFPAGYAGGTIGVSLGEHDVAIAVQPQAVRELRVRVADAPAVATPGEEVRIVTQLVNAGDLPETVVLSIAGELIEPLDESPRTLGPGSIALVESVVRISGCADDGAEALLEIAARDDGGERGSAACSLRIRDRARSAAVDRPDPAGESFHAVVHATLRAPAEVVAGAVLALGLDLDIEDDVESLAIRVPPVAGAAYIAGSSSVDAGILLDRGDGSPFGGEGLRLRAVPAGTRVTCAWSLLPGHPITEEPLVVAASLDVDGEMRAVAPVSIGIRNRDAFAARPATRAYHLEAVTLPVSATAPAGACDVVVAAIEDVAPPPHQEHVAFRIRLDAERRDEIARLLDGAPERGLIPHVLALRACFPDECTPHAAPTADALEVLRDALHDVYDRLFVKLRIPGFVCSADDLEDPQLRNALVALWARLGRERDVTALRDAPYGAPAALRALVALLPTESDDPFFCDALARFAAALDVVLVRYADATPAVFDDALARGGDLVLERARSALRAAASAQRSALEPAC